MLSILYFQKNIYCGKNEVKQCCFKAKKAGYGGWLLGHHLTHFLLWGVCSTFIDFIISLVV